MLRFIGKVIRLDILFAISTFLFAILLAIGYKFLWTKVVGWIDPATAPPTTLLDIAKRPIWLSFWTAIVTWWLILFALIARKSGAGGGTIYTTASGRTSNMDSFTVNIPVGYEEPDQEEGWSFFFGAVCFGAVLIILSLLPGLAISGRPDSADPYRTNYANPTISSASEGMNTTIGLMVTLAVPISFLAFPISGRILGSSSSFMRLFRKIACVLGGALCLQALAWAVIFVLCAANLMGAGVANGSATDSGVVVTASSASVDYSSSYVREMPSVDRVVADMRNSDTLDTFARQDGAFNQLKEMMEVMSNGRIPFGMSAGTPTPEEVQLNHAYSIAAEKAQTSAAAAARSMPGANLGMNSPWAKWLGSETNYETSRSFRDDLLKRYFSANWQSRYLADLKAKG